jgi:preprotein translocase subunit YajC
MMQTLTCRFIAAALLLAAPLAPAAAQQPAASVAVGMPVVDVKEGPVGTITARNGDSVTLKTDLYEIPLAAGSFTVQEGRAYFGMTRAQVNAEHEKAMAAAKASLAVGSPVKGLAGTPIGTIDAIDDQKVVIKLPGGQAVELPRSGIRGGANGAVVGISAAELADKVSNN